MHGYIYLFKTSVKTEKEVRELKPYLDELLTLAKWSFDLEDCDKVLRIHSLKELFGSVNQLLQDKGFECEKLTD